MALLFFQLLLKEYTIEAGARMNEKKRVGAPRKTPEGGQRVTFYLPKDVTAWIREQGGARWIRQQAYKAMGKNESQGDSVPKKR